MFKSIFQFRLVDDWISIAFYIEWYVHMKAAIEIRRIVREYDWVCH